MILEPARSIANSTDHDFDDTVAEMAPVNQDQHASSSDLSKRIPLDSSSLLNSYLNSLPMQEREMLTRSSLSKRSLDEPDSYEFSTSLLIPRDDLNPTATAQPSIGGALNPADINNKGIQAVFALIGCSFVLAAIWFFFVAKNGGFVFKEGDWEEYKSTVLRRKGPNGTTLSNATKSTRLGGGSVVGSGYSDQDTYADETSTVYTGTMSELSSSTAPIISEKQRRERDRRRTARSETAKERKQREMSKANFEGGNDRDVRAYMKEKPAAVGGLNTQSDTMHYGTDYTESEVSRSAYAASHTYQPRDQPRRASRSPDKRTRRDFSYNHAATESTLR